MAVRKIDLEIVGGDHEKLFPKEVIVSEKAWLQVTTLCNIFKSAYEYAYISLCTFEKDNELGAKIFPASMLFSKKTGLFTGGLEAHRKFPGDLTTMANEIIGELYEKVMATDSLLLIDTDLNEPKGFAIVKDEKLQFGLE